MWLHIDRLRQLQSSIHEITNRNILPMQHISRQHARLHPIQPPRIFHRHNRIRAGNHALQNKRPVKIALIPAKQIHVRYWIVRHQRHHHSANLFLLLLHHSFNTDNPRRNRRRHLSRRSRRNAHLMSPRISGRRRHSHHRKRFCLRSNPNRVLPRRQIFKRKLPRRISLLERHEPPPRVLHPHSVLFRQRFVSRHFDGHLQTTQSFSARIIQLLSVLHQIHVRCLLSPPRVRTLHSYRVAPWRNTRYFEDARPHRIHPLRL